MKFESAYHFGFVGFSFVEAIGELAVGIARPKPVDLRPRKVDIRLPGNGNSKLPRRKAGPLTQLGAKVDLDQ